jgi:hypothetical protein
MKKCKSNFYFRLAQICAVALCACKIAFADSTLVIQGEDFTPSNSKVTISDGALNLWTAAPGFKDISLPTGTYQVVVTARGDIAPLPGGYPIMLLAIDSIPNVVGSATVNKTAYAEYPLTVSLSKSSFRLFVRMKENYTDRSVTPVQDRNLFIAQIAFTRLDSPSQNIPLKGSLVVSWKANVEPDLAGYKIYYARQSRFATDSFLPSYEYVVAIDKQRTDFTVANLLAGNYYLAMTAFDSAGNESTFSEEKSITLPEVTIAPGAPAAPGNIRIQILFQETR